MLSIGKPMFSRGSQQQGFSMQNISVFVIMETMEKNWKRCDASLRRSAALETESLETMETESLETKESDCD